MVAELGGRGVFKSAPRLLHQQVHRLTAEEVHRKTLKGDCISEVRLRNGDEIIQNAFKDIVNNSFTRGRVHQPFILTKAELD
jgi:hypothetical protein